MSATQIPSFPEGNQWKDVNYVARWKAGRRKKLESKWGARINAAPLLTGVPLAADCRPDLGLSSSIELVQWENETLTHRARRLEGAQENRKPGRPSGRSRHQVPDLIARDGTWFCSPVAARAKPEILRQAKAMYDAGLEKKAQRQVACGIIGGEVVCKTGHAFRVPYACGGRYCPNCGARAANRLFAKQKDRLLFVATRLLMCGQEDCPDCNKAIEEKRVPHWPPPRGIRPRMVVAQMDFTLRNTGATPGPEMMRLLNQYIKKFCRAMERQFHIKRSEYGIAYCDELGGNNTNAHAHAIYVGPWLPQRKGVCELSQLWAKVTGYQGPRPQSMPAMTETDTPADPAALGGFILSIKYATDFFKGLYHAVKYPAKFAEKSSPERRAELEAIFHRVRRFHTLAAFYAPEVPEAEKPPVKRCPICNEALSEVKIWQTIAELERRGLRDLSTVESEVARDRGLTGAGPPKNTINCDLVFLPEINLPRSELASGS